MKLNKGLWKCLSLCLFEIDKQLERYNALAEYLYSNLRLTKLLLCNNSYATKFLTLCYKYFLMLEKFRKIAVAFVSYQNLVVGSNVFSCFFFYY
jgi:hypothetical protein